MGDTSDMYYHLYLCTMSSDINCVMASGEHGGTGSATKEYSREFDCNRGHACSNLFKEAMDEHEKHVDTSHKSTGCGPVVVAHM